MSKPLGSAVLSSRHLPGLTTRDEDPTLWGSPQWRSPFHRGVGMQPRKCVHRCCWVDQKVFSLSPLPPKSLNVPQQSSETSEKLGPPWFCANTRRSSKTPTRGPLGCPGTSLLLSRKGSVCSQTFPRILLQLQPRRMYGAVLQQPIRFKCHPHDRDAVTHRSPTPPSTHTPLPHPYLRLWAASACGAGFGAASC
jgi:hypothetical protein